MGFSIRVAPGVRVSASSRGVRTSVGTRAARVHVGGGRPGISTGVGPVRYYSSLGGGSASSGGGRATSSTSGMSRQLAAAARAQEAQEIQDAFMAISDLHRPGFPSAQRPVAPPPPPVDVDALREEHRSAALRGIGLFDRRARAAARAAADAAATAESERIAVADAAAHARYQEQLDGWWARLMSNEPETVMCYLAGAFEDNEADAAALDISGGEASLMVLVPGEEAIPERRPDVTPAGNLTLKKLTKAELADWYRALVAGYALATVKEALAVAPGLTGARIIALRKSRVDAYGKQRVEAVFAAHFTRGALYGIRWQEAASTTVITDAADELTINLAPRTNAMLALDLTKHPEIAAALDAIDLDLTA